ncbi:PE family protein [Mycobacterium kiyosense]|uniref:PE family protein n=11 Tax=Mycobacterium kiyosense TaxID=2871094 RepID=A0AA37PVP9_9MYCO|nr:MULTISPECIES: PE-PPE domain-containing protein [Mycobacterium]BDB39932.1 PE family protein [Mycobacterium kiyosense]BDE11783.1 PE family protein [Mycobacterium sp. 20KCMC460]GLB84775.1 PE family protein [Mycobacterium kiyosense]GLC19023.1 PE family protein [Mycobacterium kiyosense]GLD23725.1 PE family protein [Mycobacterium kiyosense]
MSFLVNEPHVMATAAADLEGIASALSTAGAAAAGPTSSLLAAAGDEVSAAIADLFGAYGRQCQDVLTHASAFQYQFQQSLGAAANAYANAETAIANSLPGLLGAPSAPAPGAVSLPPFPPNLLSIIIGGTGVPIPTPKLINGALDLYIRPDALHPTVPFPLVTPEELYPLTGVRSMTLNASVQEGLNILDGALYKQIAMLNQPVTVFGISQSSVIASLEMRNLAAGTSLFGAHPPDPSMLNFVLTGNEMNPNGGMLSRFPGLALPALGLDFYGATPSDTPYQVANYTLEYDGFADFPRYPLNFLADLNALAGIIYVHPTYFDLSVAQVNNAVQLPTSPGYTGNTTYYAIPTQNLPLLEPLRALPVIGNPLANLLQPDLKALVNLGYGDPAHGYSTSYADVATPFGLFPEVPPQVVTNALVAGTQQGIHDFSVDLQALAAHPPTLPSFAAPTPGDLLATAARFPSPERIVNTAATIISTDYAVLLPTADIALSLATAMPIYDAQLFAQQLALGSVVNAIGYPLAANVGLATIAGGVEALTILAAVSSNVSAVESLLA